MKKVQALILAVLILVMMTACAMRSSPVEPVQTDNSADTPAGIIGKLFAFGDAGLTLFLAGKGAWQTYSINDWYAGRFQVLLDSYEWTKLDRPGTEPSAYWLTAKSADETASITFWADSGAGMVQFSDGTSSAYWKASSGKNGAGSIAEDVRWEYDNLDVDCSRIFFPLNGTAQEAAEYFVHNAYGEHMAHLEPGNIYGFGDYEVMDWAVREVSAGGNACVGYFKYAFVPWDFNSPGIWAGNTSEGSGEYEGKLTCYREFVLQLQEDGNWHCTGLGTGGYTLPEQS